MAASTILFEDIFDVKDIDQDGKKFERGVYFINLLCRSKSLDIYETQDCRFYVCTTSRNEDSK